MAIMYSCTTFGEMPKPFGADEMVSFDIIRLDDNGKVAEHWDAMTPLGKKKLRVEGHRQTDQQRQQI